MDAGPGTDTDRMCFHTLGCSRNTETLLSCRLEKNQRDGDGLGADTGRICLHTPGCSRNTETLTERLEMNQRVEGRAGSRCRLNVLSYFWLLQKHRHSSVRYVRDKSEEWGQDGKLTHAECAFILLLVPETQELFCQIG